jgi:hypothetical protein
MTNAVEAIIEFASDIQDHGQRDRWGLAYLILTATPAEMPAAEVSRVLNEVCVKLGERDICKMDGSLYMPAYLLQQRRVALAWAPDERQEEASFETHLEHMGDTRDVFLALCAHARGEEVTPPARVTSIAWKAATAKIATRRKGYKVQAQAVRMALGKGSKNTPTRLEGVTFSELLRHLTVGIEGMRAFNARVSDYDLDVDDRARFIKVLDALQSQVTLTRTAIAIDLSDDTLAELLNR